MCFNDSSSVHSCAQRCGKILSYPLICQCDPTCLVFGDCCLNYEQECLQNTAHVPVECDYKESHQEGRGRQDYLNRTLSGIGSLYPLNLGELMATLPNITQTVNEDFDLELRLLSECKEKYSCIQTSQFEHYFLISYCGDPAFFGSNLEYLCGNVDKNDHISIVPVVAHGKHYRNIYCAFCSGVQYDSVHFWSLQMACANGYVASGGALDLASHLNTYVIVRLLMNLCRSEVVPSDVPQAQKPRLCHPPETNVSGFHKISQESAILCNVYNSPLRVNGHWFKNIHCANLSDEFLDNTPEIICNGFYDSFKYSRPFSLPLLFNFSRDHGAELLHDSTAISRAQTPNCSVNEWFDPFLAECRTRFCPASYDFKNGECVNKYTECTPSNRTWIPVLKKSASRGIEWGNGSWLRVRAISDDESALRVLVNSFKLAVGSQEDGVDIRDIETMSTYVNLTSQEHTVVFEMRLTHNRSRPSDLPYNLRRAFKMLHENDNVILDDLVVEWQSYESLAMLSLLCNRSSGTLVPREMWFTNTTSYTDVEYNTLLGHEYMFDNYIPMVLKIFTDHKNMEWSRLVFHCCQILMPCKLLNFISSEFERIGDNLLHKAGGVLIPPDKYIFTVEGHIAVCESVLIPNASLLSDFITAQTDSLTLLSNIGNGISMISSLSAITTFLIFKELQNLPGKIYICLLLSMFVASLVLLVGSTTPNTTLCLIIAISLHFSWLSIFFWTNSLAIDLTRTFRPKSTRVVHRIQGNMELAFYCLYSWTVPAAIVIVCVVIHFMKGPDDSVYDCEGSCWLQQGRSILLAFNIPVGILLLTNMLLLTIVLYGITKVRRESEQMQDTPVVSENVANFKLVLKVSFL